MQCKGDVGRARDRGGHSQRKKWKAGVDVACKNKRLRAIVLEELNVPNYYWL